MKPMKNLLDDLFKQLQHIKSPLVFLLQKGIGRSNIEMQNLPISFPDDLYDLNSWRTIDLI